MNNLILAFFITVIQVLPLPNREEDATTIIILRHAEKEQGVQTDDPGLSEEGTARAYRISEFLKDQEIAAVYATPYQRTIQTVNPVARENGIAVQQYHPVDPNGFQSILDQNIGKTIIICGHSNTVPLLLKFFDPESEPTALQEDEFDNSHKNRQRRSLYGKTDPRLTKHSNIIILVR